jgi:hypothetical protein
MKNGMNGIYFFVLLDRSVRNNVNETVFHISEDDSQYLDAELANMYIISRFFSIYLP